MIKINSDFRDETENLKSLLIHVRSSCDDFDDNASNNEIPEKFIEAILNAYSDKIKMHFLKIRKMVRDFTKEEYQIHQKYYQKELVPFFEISPYNKRVYEKPFGYPGDYIMMLYLYDNGYEGDTTFAKFVHRFSMNVPAAKANRNRRIFYKAQIENVIANIDDPKIASIACGPAVEVVEVLLNKKNACKASFVCLDFEKRALDHVRDKIEKIGNANNAKHDVQFINADVRDLLSMRSLDSLFENQDLIYSSGLIDYFSDKMSSRMIELLFKKLKKSGTLVVGNVSDEDEFIAYTDFLGEWNLNRRSEQDMMKLTAGITDNTEVKIEREQETGMNIFMSIRKL